MIISHSRKFTFVHIHKAGGTSVERALAPHLAWNDLQLGSTDFGDALDSAYKARHGLAKHGSVADIERICGPAYVHDYYLFALVRHPLDRICSLYNFVGSMIRDWAVANNIDPKAIGERITPALVAKHPVLQWKPFAAFLGSKDFSGFLRHEAMAEIGTRQTQISMLTGLKDGALCGTAFRMEDGARWHDAVKRALSLDFPLLHENKTRVRFMAPEKISHEDRVYIGEIFAADMAAFGY